MACEHDLGEMDTAAHFDGLCPICLLERNVFLARQNERQRAALAAIANGPYNKDPIVIARDALTADA